MKTWIGAAIVTTGVSFGVMSLGVLSFAGLAFGSPVATGSSAALAAPARFKTAASQTANSPKATDLSARRRYRHHYRYADRPVYRPYYYDRPYYYRPYPYDAPLPFFLGFGFGPW